jgi:hypothetical protein
MMVDRKNGKMNKLPGTDRLSTKPVVTLLNTFGGAEGIRTPDPLNANQMLSR